VSPVELADRIQSLPRGEWMCDLTEAEWGAYVQVAREVQQTEPEIVVQALDEFMTRCSPEEALDSDVDNAGPELLSAESRAFILMRVVFCVPEDTTCEETPSFKSWYDTTFPPDGERWRNYSASCPVSWALGRPLLLSWVEDLGAPAYAARREYLFMLSRFPMRDLAKIRWEQHPLVERIDALPSWISLSDWDRTWRKADEMNPTNPAAAIEWVRTHTDFSTAEWQQYIEVAKVIQETDPKIVAAVLDDFVRKDYEESWLNPDILLRIVFCVPEPGECERRFGRFGNSLPVLWQEGRPVIAVLYDGYDGPVYVSRAEYCFMLRHFPMRDLAQIRWEQ